MLNKKLRVKNRKIRKRSLILPIKYPKLRINRYRTDTDMEKPRALMSRTRIDKLNQPLNH